MDTRLITFFHFLLDSGFQALNLPVPGTSFTFLHLLVFTFVVDVSFIVFHLSFKSNDSNNYKESKHD